MEFGETFDGCYCATDCAGAIRQMKDDEMPLSVCLSWTDEGGIRSLENNKFILQEADTGEIEILVSWRKSVYLVSCIY